MSAIAIKEMENNETIWQKYFNDFTHHYLHLTAASSDNLEHELVKLTFTDILKSYSEMKAIGIHCHMHLKQVDLAKIAVSLKPLGQLEVFKADEHSLYPRNSKYFLVTTLHTAKSTLGNSGISKIVIDCLFEALVSAVYGTDKSIRLSSLQKWFSSYRDMVIEL